MSITEKELLLKGKAAKTISLAMEGSNDPAAEAIRNYFKVPKQGRAANDIIAALDDPDFVALVADMIGAAPAALSSLPTLKPNEILLGIVCRDYDTYIRILNSTTGEIREDYYDGGAEGRPCLTSDE